MALVEVPTVAYTTPTGPIIQAAQDEVIALLNQFLGLLPNSSTGALASSPDYDAIRPELETNIRAEIAAIIVAVDATPIA